MSEVLQPKTRRRYSDKQKAQALAILGVNSGNLSATSRATHIPIKTLADWRDDLESDPDFAELRNESTLTLSDKLEGLAHLLANAAPGKIAKAALPGTVSSLGIVIDKMQLLRGQPTEIIELVQSEKVLVLLADALSDAIDVTRQNDVIIPSESDNSLTCT